MSAISGQRGMFQAKCGTIAALFIITSIWPKRPITWSISFLTLSSSRTSAWIAKVSVSALSSVAVFFAKSALKSAITTFAFSLAKVIAACLPMPWPLPVITTTLFSNTIYLRKYDCLFSEYRNPTADSNRVVLGFMY